MNQQLINVNLFSSVLFQPSDGHYIDEVESENEESEEDEDVFDAPTKTAVKAINNEHSDINSYSWLVLKLATLKIVQNRINDFLTVIR